MKIPNPAGGLSRRRLLKLGAGAMAAAHGLAGLPGLLADEPATATTAESLAGIFHASLTPSQREAICFPWDYVHPKFGLLRTRVANNWNATKPSVAGTFYTPDQQRLIREIFESLIRPDWHARFDKQLEDDAGGFGHSQSVALLGEPGTGKFQFLLTGRHMTLRCDGDSAEHLAFGGPIFYGHDTGTFNEDAGHSGNVFWSQAVAANGIYTILDGRQRDLALVAKLPPENAIAFQGGSGPKPNEPAGIPITELSADQRGELERVLGILLEPFRGSDQAEARKCLSQQGGLEACRLAFYSQDDTGNDGVWDCWRLEGPSFVWHYRGAPHVHVWVNIADTPAIATNA